MRVLFNIRSVAWYEVKIVTRNAAFIAFSVIMLLLTVLFGTFVNRAVIPSSIILHVLAMLSPFLAAAVAIVAVERLHDERRTHTSRVFRSRPVGNAELVFGRFIGLLTVFMVLSFAVSFVTAIIIPVFGEEIPVVPVTHVFYPLALALPLCAFMLGLTLLADVVFRNRAIVMVCLLSFIGVMVFSLDGSWHHLLDFRGVRAPMLFSGIAGFGSLRETFLLRSMYLLLGLMLAWLAAGFMDRLPQARHGRLRCFYPALACLAGVLALGYTHLSGIEKGEAMRREINALNAEISRAPRVTLDTCRIDLIHRGRIIEASAALRFTNETAGSVGRYAFSLNPGLEVKDVRVASGALAFDRRLHVLSVTPVSPLAPGMSDSLIVCYRGYIDERACYPDIPAAERDMDNIHESCAIARRYAFIQPRYVILTRESLWYPVPGASTGGADDFTRFELTVRTSPGLTAISQGRAEHAGGGSFRFVPETPLPRISLAIGSYEHKKTVVDSVEYGIYVTRGNDFFSRHFRELGSKALAGVIREARQDFEGRIGLDYSFRRFSIVEVPVQFLAHERLESSSPETLQPEQVFVQERGVFIGYNIIRRIRGAKLQMQSEGKTPTPEEIRAEALREYINDNFHTVDMTQRWVARYRADAPVKYGRTRVHMLDDSPFKYDLNLFPQFYSFRNMVGLGHNALLSLALGYFLESRLPHRSTGTQFFFPPPDDEIASRTLAGRSLSDVLSDPLQRSVAREVLQKKSEALFAFFKTCPGYTDDRFDAFIREFMDRNRFRTASTDEFASALRERFGIDAESMLEKWAAETTPPRYEISGLRALEIPGPDGPRYNVLFTIYNPESVEGVVRAYLSLPEEFRREDNERYIYLAGGQAKEIGLVTEHKTESLGLDTFVSQHIPRNLGLWVGNLIPTQGGTVFTGERPSTPPRAAADSGIVIVDDLDPGFSIPARPGLKLLERFKERQAVKGWARSTWFEDYTPPNTWETGVSSDFYGVAEKSAHYIRAGKGSRIARWEASIPESGTFDLYYYNLYYFSEYDYPHHQGEPFIKDLHFRIGHAEGESEVELVYQPGKYPWAFLGTFKLSGGTAWIELSDRTKGRLVYADAVKWVKR